MGKKNYKKGKKLATYALASAMVLSNLGYVSSAFAAETYKPGNLEAKVKQLKQLQTRESFKERAAAKTLKASLKATDKVRVIVEVEGQTPVEFATKQGVLYKELSEDKKSSLSAKVDSQQKSVKDKIAAKGINVKYKQKYSTAFNGFSGEVAYGDLSKIEAVSGVKNVYLANEYNRPVTEPNMKTSHQFIQSYDTWTKSGFKGEGMVVSVIDTGVDPSHRDFKLTDNKKEELSKTEVSQLVQENSLKGKFYTDKVPYGYNYYDQNSEILDLGPGASMHGMHVAGTVAANGDTANGGIKGVAPEAQVLAMKVFSNDPLYPSTWSDVYLAAIDDSIKLGADVLNMSLGSTASFYDENSAEDLAIQRATENGIVCAVSAGNSNTFGNGWDNPYAKNPDIGVVGAPGLNPDTISVAAAGNEAYRYQHAIKLEGNTTFSSVGFGLDDWTKLVNDNGGKLELVSIEGMGGSIADFQGKDVKGKVVVVPRGGGVPFADKTKYAAAAGAAGIIVWNATGTFFYEDQGGWEIPFMHISKADGEALNAAIAAGQTTLTVAQTSKTEDPEMGRITDFSSWGTTPSLEMKPEITAPGGNIYSTVNNDKYELMSGTSMAAPHVAGGSALVQQYLQTDKRFGSLSVEERTKLAKVLLMNTAKVITDVEGNAFSPRAQGAGMMQLESAVTTPAYVVNKSTGEAKVELKDFNSTQFSMTFTVKNVSDKEVAYHVNTDVLTDVVLKQTDSPDYNAKRAADLEGAVVNGPTEVKVGAGQTADFTVSVDFSNAKIPGVDAQGQKTLLDLYKNIFVEGSVNLVSSDSTIPSLTVPYVGFYGNWDEPEIVDGFATLGEDRFYNLADAYGEGATDAEDQDGYFVSPVPEKNVFALSPNEDGYYDGFNPIPSFLRNASEVQFNILDENGSQLRRIKAESDVLKNYFDGGSGNLLSYNGDRMWDGTVKGETVKDGLYYYEIKSVIDYAGAKWQSKKIPVYVDTTAPKVTATYDPEKSAVSWKTEEDGTGVEVYGIFVGEDLVGVVDGKTTSYQLTDVPDKAVVEVLAIDYANNAGYDTAAIGDVDMPLVYITDGAKDRNGEYVANSPEPYGAYSSNEVPVKGIVVDDTGIKSVKVNGKEVPVVGGKFSTTVTFEQDGQYDVIVEVVDHSNKVFAISRKVFIDTTGPVINVKAPERVDKNVDKVTLDVNLQDNYNYINFYVGEDHEFEVPVKSPVDLLAPLNKDTKVTVPLKEGANTVVLRATDLAGNETVKEVVINRANEGGWVEKDGAWYYYEDGIKHTGWLELSYSDEEWGGEWTEKYYFDKDGKMHTGWLELDGSRYYFTEDGLLLTDTIDFVQESKNFFAFDVNGAAKTGFEEFLDQKAYFDAKTGLAKNVWKLVDGAWYYAAAGGALQTGWLELAGKWYFFNNDAKMQTGWINDGKSNYYLTESGAMATGWTKVDGKWYYFNTSGLGKTGWIKDGKDWYFLDKAGLMQTGWVKDGGKWYFLDNSGAMKTGWVKDSGKWYFLDGSGAMKTGWFKDSDGKWYFLNNSGDMATGWKLVDGKWYYLYPSGVMAANTTVEGYKLGADGAWIK